MALFFFISGFTTKSLSVKKVLKKGCNFFGVQVFVGLMNCVWYWGIMEVLLDCQIEQRWMDYFNTWYLPTMFWMLLVYAILNKWLKTKRGMLIGGAITLGVAYMMMYVPNVWDILHFRKVPLALFMFLLGKIARDVIERDGVIKNILKVVLCIGVIIILIITNVFNENVYWYNYSIGNYGLAVLSSLAGCLLCLIISIQIGRNKVLEWFGRNSLTIYAWNFIVTRISALWMNHLFPVGKLRFVLSMVISIIVVTIITIMTNIARFNIVARVDKKVC